MLFVFLGWTIPLFFMGTPFQLIVPSGLIVSWGFKQSHIPLSFCFINLRAFLDALITGFREFRLGSLGQYQYAVKNIWVLLFHVCFWVGSPTICALNEAKWDFLAMILNWMFKYNKTCWNVVGMPLILRSIKMFKRAFSPPSVLHVSQFYWNYTTPKIY